VIPRAALKIILKLISNERKKLCQFPDMSLPDGVQQKTNKNIKYSFHKLFINE